MSTKKIAVFASGSGTNAQRIIEYFSENEYITVRCLLANTPKAYALVRAQTLGIETLVFSRDDFYQTSVVLDFLRTREIDLVVLAGFLWLVPPSLIGHYPIVNIHPALLPKYGGKNMYGHYVHEAVIRNGDKISGITVHYVNEDYDEGAIIFQATCEVHPGDTPESLAERIHLLEYKHYPAIIEQVIKKL